MKQLLYSALQTIHVIKGHRSAVTEWTSFSSLSVSLCIELHTIDDDTRESF